MFTVQNSEHVKTSRERIKNITFHWLISKKTNKKTTQNKPVSSNWEVYFYCEIYNRKRSLVSSVSLLAAAAPVVAAAAHLRLSGEQRRPAPPADDRLPTDQLPPAGQRHGMEPWGFNSIPVKHPEVDISGERRPSGGKKEKSSLMNGDYQVGAS